MPVDPSAINDPPEIAARHGRMVECAILSGEKDKAIAAVERAFAMLAELADDRVTYDDCIDLIVAPRMVELLHAGGIETVGDLCEHSRDSLVMIHQIRYRSVDLIERSLAKHGLALSRAE